MPRRPRLKREDTVKMFISERSIPSLYWSTRSFIIFAAAERFSPRDGFRRFMGASLHIYTGQAKIIRHGICTRALNRDGSGSMILTDLLSETKKIGILSAVMSAKQPTVFIRQFLGYAHHPPAGDQTSFGY